MTMYVAALVLTLGWTATADALNPDPDARGDPAFDWVLSFDWQTEPRIYSVVGANANFRLGEDEVALFGAKAGRFAVELERAVLKAEGPLADSMIVMAHVPMGFVHDDDWHELDADDLLDAIRANTSRDNAERVSRGRQPIEILGWSQRPTFDTNKKVVYWALKAKSEEGQVINASAIQLPRDGFTQVTWIGNPDQFLNAESALNPAISRYDYDQGWRYADFGPGDAVAGFGIAALTRQMVTGRTGKAVATTVGAGIMAIAAAFAKKLWFLIFLPFIALWHLFRRRSRT